MTGPMLDPAPGAVAEYVFPLSFQQTRWWYLEHLDPGGAAYHMPAFLRLSGPVRPDALAAAVRTVVDRHEILRTRYEPDTQVQVVAGEADPVTTVVDLSALPGQHRAAELARLRAAVAARPFDLWRTAPMRVVLVRLSTTEHLLMIVVHHIACDGWSLGVLAEELSTGYRAFLEDTEPRLPELAIQYGDFALWQRDRLTPSRLRDELAFWTDALTGAPTALALPADRSRSNPREGGRVRHQVDPAVLPRLTRLCQTSGASLFMVAVTGFAIVLGRAAGQDDVVIGTATAGRARPETAPLVGCFIDVLPVRVSLTGDPTVGELLGRVRAAGLAALAHQDVPFERIVEHLQPVRDPRRPPLFQVMLNAQDTPRPEVRWPGVTATPDDPGFAAAKYDLVLDLHTGADGLLLALEYDSAVFDVDTVRGWLGQFATLLDWLATVPATTRLSAVDIPAAPAVEVPRIEPPADTARAGGVEPRDALEALVLDHVRRVLDKPGLGVTDDFFDHGGSSLTAMTLMLAIERATGHRLDVRELFADATAEGFAARLRAADPEQRPDPTTESEHTR